MLWVSYDKVLLKDQVKADSKYLNEDPQIKQNYDDAVQRVETIINETQNLNYLKQTLTKQLNPFKMQNKLYMVLKN